MESKKQMEDYRKFEFLKHIIFFVNLNRIFLYFQKLILIDLLLFYEVTDKIFCIVSINITIDQELIFIDII